MASNTVSIIFNGSTDRLESLPNQEVGIGNAWALSFWLKPTLFVPQAASDSHRTLFHMKGSTPRSEILIWAAKLEGSKNEEEIHVEINNSLGQKLRITRFNKIQKHNQWRNFSCVWDGTNLIAYDQGLLVTDHSILISGGGIMNEPPGGRILRVGDLLEATEPSLAAWSGTLGHIGVWDIPLGAGEYPTLISGGFDMDLLTNSGTYTSSASLIHYWKPGDDFPNVGFDFAGNINIASGTNATATGINSVVIDQP